MDYGNINSFVTEVAKQLAVNVNILAFRAILRKSITYTVVFLMIPSKGNE